VKQNKIRFVTANYAQLQGLRLVPIGVVLLLLGVVTILGFADPVGVAPADRARFLTRMGYAFWIGLGLALAAPAYYRHRYGSVDGLDRRRRNRWITAAVIAFFVLARVDSSLNWPVSLSLLLVAVSLFVTAWHEEWIRPYYPAVALVWLVAACLPALGVPAPGTRLTLCFLGGLTLIVIGVGDHLLLTRSLANPPNTDDACHSTSI
jgi:hypothetical protein